MSNFTFKTYNEHEVIVRFSDLSKLESENNELKKQLEEFESGKRGACSTCELVGELNKKLEGQLKEAIVLVADLASDLESEGLLAYNATEFLAKYRDGK